MERSIPASPELERRIRAAAGYALLSVEGFSDAVGISHTTLYRVFRGERHLKRMELREMASVAKLPVEFFFADFELLTSTNGASQIAQAMGSADQDARDRPGESPEEPEAREN